jgi:hypothetical protein
MKGRLKMKKQNITFTLAILSLSCFGVLPPKAFAVSPSPDGCYPGFTTAEGCKALQNLTTGAGNTGVGWFALFGTSTGNFNTAIGAGTLVTNNQDANTAVGAAALLLNTAGTDNSALGTAAMVNNDNGADNTAVGAFALQTNTNGSNNTALGDSALSINTGDFNTALGSEAGSSNDTGSNNIYIGDTGGTGESNVIAIGNLPISGTDYAAFYVGGVVGAQIPTGNAVPVYIDSTSGQLGTQLVDANGKKATTHSARRGARPQAQINEFQKQQKRIADLESTVARLAATVKEQAAQIEKVSAQLELQKPAQRVVANKE